MNLRVIVEPQGFLLATGYGLVGRKYIGLLKAMSFLYLHMQHIDPVENVSKLTKELEMLLLADQTVIGSFPK